MKKAKLILCLFLAIVTLFTLVACSKTNQPSATSQPGTTGQPNATVKPGDTTPPPASGNETTAPTKPTEIVMGETGYLGRFLDGTSPAISLHAADLVYDTLFRIDPKTKEPYSRILESWEYTDELTFVMKLKPGVTFTNGNVADADDLLFAIMNHVERQDLLFSTIIETMDIPNCTSDGEYTVTLKFNQPYGPGIFGSAYYLYDMDYCHEVGWDSPDWNNNPNGTGPYIVTDYATDDHITLQLKDNYWNSANEQFDVQKWTIKYFPDIATMYMALEKGEVALCPIYNFADYSRWLDNPGENIGMNPCNMGATMLFMMGPNNDPALADIRVREALAIGVDWAAIGQMIMGDLYVPATSTLVSDSPFYKNVGAYEYNPERAKQILADAGYKEGDIHLYIYDMAVDLRKNLDEAFQAYAKDLGITVEIEFGDIASCMPRWTAPAPDGCDFGWMNIISGNIIREPHASYSSMYTPFFTWGMQQDPVFLEMATKALNTIGDARIPLYHDVQQYIYDNYLAIPLYEDFTVVAYRTDIFTPEVIADNSYTSMFVALRGLSLAG